MKIHWLHATRGHGSASLARNRVLMVVIRTKSTMLPRIDGDSKIQNYIQAFEYSITRVIQTIQSSTGLLPSPQVPRAPTFG